MTLYVIGNGFDLAHDLRTSYCHYKDFIKDNLKRYYKWDAILDFYPEDYEFWSDIEYNVCKINKEHYLKLKKLFSFGLLDELYRRIHESFEKFILNRESAIFSLKPKFEFDDDSYFFTFNYTTVLEDVYKIDKKRITYIHNDISGPAMDILYNIQNHAPCIIGHSSLESDYVVQKELLNDKEYLDYVKTTTKDCELLLKQKGILNFLKDERFQIDKVVFYGLSFSITDRKYIEAIFNTLRSETKYIVFYKESNKVDSLSLLRQRISDYGININKIEFIECGKTHKL